MGNGLTLIRPFLIKLRFQALVERGEKLSQVEEATAQMMINAQQFSRNAEGLADKYKNKKWYQL